MSDKENTQPPKKRAPNFNTSDKDVLLGVVYKYKDILENKKTDAVHNEEKARCWSRIAIEYNASGATARGPDQLKKLYNNLKKNLRKNAAEERKELLLTGGGIAKTTLCPHDELLLSIVNEKTVGGMENRFDGDHIEIERGDVEDNEAIQPQDIMDASHNPLLLVDLVAQNQNVNERPNDAGPSTKTWNSYTACQLQTPKNPSLATNRRRPTPIIKALTSSHVASKYDMLLDKRLSIAILTERELTDSLEHSQRKRAIELELLNIELEIKKEQLKKIKNDS